LGLAAGACVLGVAGVVAALAGSPAAADPGPSPLPLPSLPLPSLSPLQLPPIQLPALPAPLPSSIPLPPLPVLAFPSAAAPAASGLDAYRGLGAWVDLYDYGGAGNPAPESLVAGMAQRGVRTLFVETARWTS